MQKRVVPTAARGVGAELNAAATASENLVDPDFLLTTPDAAFLTSQMLEVDGSMLMT